jgi:hypothetical protein
MEAADFRVNAVGYPGFTYDATNRFWYWRLTKSFNSGR